MKRSLLCILLIAALNHVSAQKINLDSLVKVAISLKSGNKINAPSNPDSLLKTLFTIKSPATRIRMVYDIILLDNGELNPAQALYYHHKILDLARKYNDVIIEAVITGELGYVMCQDGDGPEGFKMILSALKLAEKTGNKQAIGTVYDNLGVCYQGGAISVTINYFKKALQLSTEGGDYLFACVELTNLKSVYQYKHDLDSARYFLGRAFELAIRKNDGYDITTLLSSLGTLQTNNGLKLKYYHDALMTPLAARDLERKGWILGLIAGVYKDEGKTDSALFYAKSSYACVNSKLIARKLNPAHLLAQLYTGKNADSTLKYTNIYYTIRDSLFSINKMERAQSMAFAEQQRQQEAAAQKQAYRTTLRTYLLTAIIVFFVILAFVFWRNNRQKQKANHLLSEQKEEISAQRDNLEQALDDLKNTQTQLVQREKMASLGELTAGIAHEIQNPLNFVNNFSELNTELVGEMKLEIEKGDLEEIKALAIAIEENSKKINMHGKRADGIVKGMLQHSQSGSGTKEPTNINVLADEYLRLSYHGLRSKDKSFNAELVTNFDEKLPKVNVIPQDIGRVMLNLFNNAFYAVNQRQKIAGEDYKPEVTVTTSTVNGQVVIKVKDNGTGIPYAVKEKIMQPFFTTKPTGEGTGLGLSLTYDMVVKGHGGQISVDTKQGYYTIFQIILPIQN